VRLSTLVEVLGTEVVARVGDDPEVRAVVHDSRAVEAGTLFCCVPGEHVDGHDFAAAAVGAGADALLVERRLDLEVAQVVVPSVRIAMAPVAARLHGDPSRALHVVGITGTNGKTTTVHLLAAILEAAGVPTGQIGTLTGARTTPEAPELQATLARLRDEGRTAVAMEVSSHALAVHRVDATWFEVAAFTNLSQDHLDFHGTMQDYFEAKASLFHPDRCARALVDVDDEWGARLAARIEHEGDLPLVRCSVRELADLEVRLTSSSFSWRGQRVHVPLGGRHNASNALLAAEAALAVGVTPEAVAAGLASAPPVPGRFELVVAGQDFDVVVDYAHTPDGLAKLLEAVRAATDGRVIVVFGCGGDRDTAKRPLMGRAAADGADSVVVTSDNPRSEHPQAIIEAVIDGIDDRQHVTVEPDRRAAIALALHQAQRGDVVVVAGKGHETTQTTGRDVRPFDDRVVARDLLLEGAS
jgi:UDP-N-acetylmuramoyl-L-alanyl-D-glutamate--2,6-diaminopimelate ligase